MDLYIENDNKWYLRGTQKEKIIDLHLRKKI